MSESESESMMNVPTRVRQRAKGGDDSIWRGLSDREHVTRWLFVLVKIKSAHLPHDDVGFRLEGRMVDELF